MKSGVFAVNSMVSPRHKCSSLLREILLPVYRSGIQDIQTKGRLGSDTAYAVTFVKSLDLFKGDSLSIGIQLFLQITVHKRLPLGLPGVAVIGHNGVV